MTARVLLVLGSSAGGVARHVAQVGLALTLAPPAGLGAQVRVAGPGGLASEIAPGGAPVGFDPVPITDRPRPGDLAVVARLRVLAAGADVVHAHGLRAGAFAVAAARSLARSHRPRVVVTLHNLPVGGLGVRAISGVLERIVARGADAVLGVSGDLVSRARSLGALDVERALVPAPDRPRPTVDAPTVRRSLGVPDGVPLVVTIARLAPQKGLSTLLDAAVLLGTTQDVVWVVAGDGRLRDDLAARIAEQNAPVRLLGRRTDVPDLLAAADVVVSTAVWEGQPIGIQEALQLGAALVVTDAGGTREVTGDDGARLVPVGDAHAVAAAVGGLLSDAGERAALARRARERAAQLPELIDVVGQLERVYGTGRSARPVE